MGHKIKGAEIPEKLYAYAKALSTVCGKKEIAKKMPMAEFAYSLAKGNDKEAAFLAVIMSAVPKEKENAAINLLLHSERSVDAHADIVNISRIINEVRVATELEKREMEKNELKIYEEKLLKNEISIATIISRIALCEEERNVGPMTQLYVYAPIAEVVNSPVGKKLRENAVNNVYKKTIDAIKKEAENRLREINKTISDVAVILDGNPSGNSEVRVKSPESAALKFEEKGYLNDLVGVRVKLEEASKAVKAAERIIALLRQKSSSLAVDDYYSNPKRSGYRGFNINFTLNGIPAEIQITDSKTVDNVEKNAPHGLHKSYGVLSMKLKKKLKDYL